MRLRKTIVGVAVCASLMSTHAAAQTGTGGIAGVVRDASGGVLPGVTVEASSPALIEKTRTVVTDGSGLYSLVDLRPGAYVVTFTLTGFSTVKREGLELTADFTATVNADMRVGAMEETITVTGASPVVDTRNVVQASIMTREILNNIPTGKLFQSIAILVPGMSVGQTLASGGQKQDVGGTLGNASVTEGIHGGRPRDQQILFDGMDVSIAQSPAIPVIILQDGNVQEMSLTYGANPAESSTGGVRINMVPKEGGNTFRGSYFGNFANSSLQANNVDDNLKQKGFGAPNRLNKIYDFNPTVGGPILRDKLWFYGAFRYFYNNNWAGGVFYNQDPTAFVYKPDLSRQGFLDQYGWNSGLRFTWQATPRNKVTGYYNYDHNCDCHRGESLLVTPDAASYLRFKTNVYQGTWSSPVTNRLLLETGLSLLWTSADYQPQPGSTQDAVTEASTGVTSRFPTGQWSRSQTYYARAALNYVTGSHAFKAGFTILEQPEVFGTYQGPDDLRYTLLNKQPFSVTYYTTPYNFAASVRPSLGVFAQDQWAIRRLTLNYGLRVDHFVDTHDTTSLPPTQWLPVARNFPAGQVVNWTDISPRLSVAYDLFGTGKTALKANLSRYVLQLGNDSFGAFYPTNASNPSTTRTWTDNGDFIVQGDPLNPAPNGELGVSSNKSFGQTIFTTKLDPAFATGFGKRPYNWDVSGGIQHQLVPNVSVGATFYRRWFGNFSIGGGTVATENLAYTAADFTPYCVTVPLDSRLPGGGGNKLCNLFDVDPTKVGLNNNLGTRAPGEYERWSGVDLSMTARLPLGLLLQGGLSTGRTTLDKCATWNNPIWTNPIQSLTSFAGQYALPPLGQITAFCHMEEPFLTQVKFIASYPLPYGVAVSAALQSIPGQPIYANYLATNAVIAPSLGRNLSSGVNGSVTVNVIPPGAQYLDRINQLDLRATKSFTVMKTTRLQAMVDCYNIFNSNTVTTANPNYGNTGSSWLAPIAILQGRFVKFGLQVTF